MRIAIIGASQDRERFSNKAVRAYRKHGWNVVPVSPKYAEVEGIPCRKSVKDIDGKLDAASFYVKPDIGIRIADEVISKQIPIAYLNPGTESKELAEKLKEGGVKILKACSIRAIGEDPSAY